MLGYNLSELTHTESTKRDLSHATLVGSEQNSTREEQFSNCFGSISPSHQNCYQCNYAIKIINK